MSPEPFARGKDAGCLSAWQVSLLAMGLDQPEAAAHGNVCQSCATRVMAEQAESADLAVERVPTSLLSRAGTPPWQRRFGWPRLLLAVLAVVLAMALVARFVWIWWHAPRAPVVAVVGKIKRPVERLGRVAPGTAVRLRVQQAELAHARLAWRQGGAWHIAYEGPVPADGFLPTQIVAVSPPRPWRLSACHDAVPPAGGAGMPGCLQVEVDL